VDSGRSESAQADFVTADRDFNPGASLRPREDGFRRLDFARDWAGRHGLACVLDLCPRSPLDGSPGILSALCAVWGLIAARCRERPISVFYELLHEAKIADAAMWREMAAQLLQAVRAEDRRHGVIVPGPGRCGPDDLAALHPLEDARLIYSFHFYDPLTFTLQGSPWEGGQYAPLRAVPYPADRAWVESLEAHLRAHSPPPRLPTSPHTLDAETAEALRQHLALQQALRPLREYGRSGCDRSTLATYMEPAVAWARRHRVPLYCSQFGVYKPFAPPDSRCRWLADVTFLLREAGAGWAIWNYRGDCAILEGGDGEPRGVDAPLAAALGLCTRGP
jgi:hypothetical protein